MLTNYKKNCEETIKGRLESVTRYKFENLKLENYKEFVVECNIEAINSMSVTYTERRVAGGGKSGELHYNSSVNTNNLLEITAIENIMMKISRYLRVISKVVVMQNIQIKAPLNMALLSYVNIGVENAMAKANINAMSVWARAN